MHCAVCRRLLERERLTGKCWWWWCSGVVVVVGEKSEPLQSPSKIFPHQGRSFPIAVRHHPLIPSRPIPLPSTSNADRPASQGKVSACGLDN